MNKCRFCGDTIHVNDIASEEHIFPRAIGGKITILPVHKKCNDFLGKDVDSKLTDNRAILIRRYEFGLVGNSRKLPNPLQGVTLKNQSNEPFVFEVGEEFKRIRHVFLNNDRLTVYQEFKDGECDEEVLERLVERVQMEIKKHALPEMTRQQVLENCEKLFQTQRLEADVKIYPLAHWPALLKIAYELGVYWLGEAYMDDPKGIELRNFILNSDGEFVLNGNIKVVDGEKVSVWNAFNQPQKNHLAVLKCMKETIGIRLRIFDVFDAMVIISENRASYPNVNDRFISIDPSSGTHFECSLESAYGRIAQIRPSVEHAVWVDLQSHILSMNREPLE